MPAKKRKHTPDHSDNDGGGGHFTQIRLAPQPAEAAQVGPVVGNAS